MQLEPDGNSFHLSFEKRKNAQFKQGNRAAAVAATSGPMCPLKLLEMMRMHTGKSEDAYVFRGFKRRLVKKSPEKISPGN